jgi:hypothetical protein
MHFNIFSYKPYVFFTIAVVIAIKLINGIFHHYSWFLDMLFRAFVLCIRHIFYVQFELTIEQIFVSLFLRYMDLYCFFLPSSMAPWFLPPKYKISFLFMFYPPFFFHVFIFFICFKNFFKLVFFCSSLPLFFCHFFPTFTPLFTSYFYVVLEFFFKFKGFFPAFIQVIFYVRTCKLCRSHN